MGTASTIQTKSLVKASKHKAAKKAAMPFFTPVIQPKLTINQPNDKYEQEADAVAGKVMRMTGTEASPTPVKPSPVIIQKKCAACDQEEKLQRKQEDNEKEQGIQLNSREDILLQRKCAACEAEEHLVQRKELAHNTAPVVSPAVYQTINSCGKPLDAATRSFMESRFKIDFSEVQIHDDAPANRSAKEINARAYTHGQHIAFASGEYQPYTQSGKQLLAHELVHTIQQRRLQKALQKKDDQPYASERPAPRILDYDAVKAFYKKAVNKQFDYYFIIADNVVEIYNESGFIVGTTFDRKSSPDLAGYFVNFQSDLSIRQNNDSWHFIRKTSNGYHPERLIPIIGLFQNDKMEEERYRLSKAFFYVLSDLGPKIDLITLSIMREKNAYDIALAIVDTNYAGTVSKEKAKPRFLYSLPAWMSQLEKSVRARLANAKALNPEEQDLPSRLVFYGSSEIQKKEGTAIWMIQVESDEQKRYVKVNKNVWNKTNDKEEFAATVFEQIMEQVAGMKRAKASREFDKKKEEENKVKEAKGSKWIALFKLRDKIWQKLQGIKKTSPAATDIPEKLTLEFFGVRPYEKPFFKIWVQKKITPGKFDLQGSLLNQPVSTDTSVDDWVVFIRKQTAIQQLILSGVNMMDLADFESRKYNPSAPVQLAPFPAQIIAKNLNPDFTTVTGASNEFVMSLNWYAVYGFKDDLSIASHLSKVRSFYDFQIIDLPAEIESMKANDALPEEIKKASTDYIEKNEPVKPFSQSSSIQRDAEKDISMKKEGSFLLVSYAHIEDPADKVPRAISAAAHPYFVTNINALADKTVLGMDVVAGLQKKLETEKDPEKRKLIEDQIKEIKEREAKGYAVQAREDIKDVDKLLTQANDLLTFIQNESRVGPYSGDFEYDPFPIRLAKKRPDLTSIYNIVKDKNPSYSFSDDEYLTTQFIHSLELEKRDLGKLAKRVETPKGKFKNNATKYKALAVSVNEDNGLIVPVMLLVGEHTESNPSKNEYKHIIYDVTTDAYDENKMLYAGDKESNEKDSVDSAFVEFGKKNNYGDGKVAYRVPALGYTGTVKSYTTAWEWIEKALMVVGLVLLAFGVILSGGALAPFAAAVLNGIALALGVSAGIMGAVLAIRNIASRKEKGTLEMNAETAMDILNIIGGFTGGLTQIGKYVELEISEAIIAAYEVAEFSGNIYLVHAKLADDMAAIKSLNLSKDDEKVLIAQAYAEAEQQGAMLLAAGIGSRVFIGETIGTKDIPLKLKEKVEKTGYTSYREKGWIDASGKVTENAPPFLREMARAVKKAGGETTETQHAPPEKTGKPATEPPVAPKRDQKPVVKEQTTVEPKDAVAEKPIHIGNEDHKIIVTKDAIGLCSPECPLIDIEYKQELIDNPDLAEKNRQIGELRKAGKTSEAAEKTAALIPELEAARAKKIKLVEPGKVPQTDTPSTPAPSKTTEEPAAAIDKPKQQGTKTAAPEPDKIPNSPSARKEADDWETIAGDYDEQAQQNKKVAEEENAKAKKLRAAGLPDEAKLAEDKAAAALQKAAEAESNAVEARNEVNKLRGGKEGLTAQQIRERQQLTEQAGKLQQEVKERVPLVQEKRDELTKAKNKLVERRDALKELDLRRRTPGTRENNLKSEAYEQELQKAKDSIDSAEKNVAAKEKALEREAAPLRKAENELQKARDGLFELDKLDKGLSEGDPLAKGNFGEAKAKEYMEGKGYKKIGGHEKPQGIDGIYRKEGNPPDNIIAEVKYVEDAKKYLNDPERAKRELLNDTIDGPQLSIEWTERRILEAVKNDKELAGKIRKESYTKVLLIYDAKTRQFLSPIIVVP